MLTARPVALRAGAARHGGWSSAIGEREALRGVDLSVAAGELVAVIGPNGAGKTTLLSILAGILKPDGGEVESAPAARSAGCRSRRRSTGG